jgi:hypothetical protein
MLAPLFALDLDLAGLPGRFPFGLGHVGGVDGGDAQPLPFGFSEDETLA